MSEITVEAVAEQEPGPDAPLLEVIDYKWDK